MVSEAAVVQFNVMVLDEVDVSVMSCVSPLEFPIEFPGTVEIVISPPGLVVFPWMAFMVNPIDSL
jgi:hypothetical protein